MNEKKKMIILLVVSFILLISIISISLISIAQSTEKLKEIENALNSNEPQIIYISRPTCYYCNLLEPITDSLQEEFELEYFNINTDNFTNSQLSKVLKTIGIKEEKFGTPYIAIVQDGKIIGEQIGYTDENILFELFKKNGLIDKDVSLHMNYIDDIKDLFSQDKSSLILIGTSGDTASIDARLTLRNLAKQYSIDINYYDTSKLENDKDYEKLLEYLSVDSLPVLVKIQNNEILAKVTKLNKKDLEEFLKENNYIK